MVSFILLYQTLLRWLLKTLGVVRSLKVEIEPGTTMNFWVPYTSSRSPSSSTTDDQKKKKTAKPAVVLIHGFALDGILTWNLQVFSLAKEYDVYIPDLIFFGGSVTDKPDRSPGFQAECLAKGLKKLGVKKCSLVGFSYGGMVGFKLAHMYPQLVESLVLTSSVIALTESISSAALPRTGFSSWSEFLLPTTLKQLKVMLQIASYKLPALPDWLLNDALKVLFEKKKRERAELLEALIFDGTHFNMPQCSKLKVYFLAGENDMIFDPDAINDTIKLVEGQAEVQYIEKAGHLVQIERPCLYNRHLKQILTATTNKN